MRRPTAALAVLVATAFLLEACGDDGSSADTSTIVAASSLTGAFGDIEVAFETEHPDVDLQISFDGSAKLASAIIEGAPADLFASADEANLQKVADEDLIDGEPVTFATNTLRIVVAEGNPADIDSLEDLTSPDVKLSLCGPEVPCGRYAALAFEKAGLTIPPAGDQENVNGVLSQVQLGEADAGIVYVTDVLGAEGVEGVDLAASAQVTATYPAAVLADAANPEVATAFLAFLTSADAQAILEDHGFGLP